MKPPRVIAATGSRSSRVTSSLVAKLDAFLKERSAKHDLKVLSGMAEGWDELVARRCIALGVAFVAALPNPGYGAYYWSAEHSRSGSDRLAELDEILSAAVEVRHVCQGVYGLLGGRRAHSNLVRNQWLVDAADELVAHREPGLSRGTDDCLRRALEAGKPWVEL